MPEVPLGIRRDPTDRPTGSVHEPNQKKKLIHLCNSRVFHPCESEPTSCRPDEGGSGHCVGPPSSRDLFEVGRTGDSPSEPFKCSKRRPSSDRGGEGRTLGPKADGPARPSRDRLPETGTLSFWSFKTVPRDLGGTSGRGRDPSYEDDSYLETKITK